MVRDAYFSRMSTINVNEYGNDEPGRLIFWDAAIRMAKDYPVLGVGFGSRNYAVLLPSYLGINNHSAVHNTYLQMLVDSGIFAMLLYTAMLFGAIIWLGASAREMRRTHPGWEYVPIALQVSLLAFSVGCTFYSMQRWDLPYYLMMSAAAWRGIVRSDAFDKEPEAEQSPSELALAGA
jgi:O-antigen ligase